MVRDARPGGGKKRRSGPTPKRRVDGPSVPQPPTRVTAPRPPRRFVFRPAWHKAVGATAIIVGAALFFMCELTIGGVHRYGGHVWYLVGLGLAASSTWWFGAFDPPS